MDGLFGYGVEKKLIGITQFCIIYQPLFMLPSFRILFQLLIFKKLFTNFKDKEDIC